jgi:hypothetical protein
MLNVQIRKDELWESLFFGRDILKVGKKFENLNFFKVNFNRRIKLLKFTIFWNVNFSN